LRSSMSGRPRRCRATSCQTGSAPQTCRCRCAFLPPAHAFAMLPHLSCSLRSPLSLSCGLPCVLTPRQSTVSTAQQAHTQHHSRQRVVKLVVLDTHADAGVPCFPPPRLCKAPTPLYLLSLFYCFIPPLPPLLSSSVQAALFSFLFLFLSSSSPSYSLRFSSLPLLSSPFLFPFSYGLPCVLTCTPSELGCSGSFLILSSRTCRPHSCGPHSSTSFSSATPIPAPQVFLICPWPHPHRSPPISTCPWSQTHGPCGLPCVLTPGESTVRTAQHRHRHNTTPCEVFPS